jgi:Holliday junction resolvase-like predicted endonuclease
LLMRYPRLARLPARFDVVEVDGEPEKLNCRLIRAAFSL